jgi:NAD(P)-dependent dehydrogenase (short-subunit alcohol dehydrogenase family)
VTPQGIIVTGGTGALGRAVVQSLLTRGDRIAVPYRSSGGFEALRSAAGHSAALWGAETDLADVESARRFVDTAAAWLGRLDGVAALAGGWQGAGPLEATPPSVWDAMLRINLASLHGTCRAALPHLLREGGSVVTVSARAVERGGSGASAYVAAKAAVAALTRVLALENADRGVRFNALSPTTIDTEANRQAMPKADRSQWTAPEDIAKVIAFLLSPASAPITGAVIPV